jgi:hypothetical protein
MSIACSSCVLVKIGQLLVLAVQDALELCALATSAALHATLLVLQAWFSGTSFN